MKSILMCSQYWSPCSMMTINFSTKQCRKLCRTSNHEHSSAILFIRPYIISHELFDAWDKRWQMNLSLSTNFLTTQTWVSFVNLSSSTACTILLPSCLSLPMFKYFNSNCQTISVGHSSHFFQNLNNIHKCYERIVY